MEKCFRAIIFGLWTAMASTSVLAAQAAPTSRSITDVTLKNLKIEGSLDLENNVPIRWKKPDGSGYVNIFMLDKNGTVQLCQDPYYWDSTDADHKSVRVIEMRNPKSQYPDFQLPVTRDRKDDTTPGREV